MVTNEDVKTLIVILIQLPLVIYIMYRIVLFLPNLLAHFMKDKYQPEITWMAALRREENDVRKK